MTFTHEDVRKLLAILDESDFEEVHIELGDLKLDLRRHGGASEMPSARRREESPRSQASVQASGAFAPAFKPADTGGSAQPAPEAALPDGVVAARAPMLGTFYRAPTPGAKPFVEVGNRVQPDDTVCLLEVMKLFNSLKAGVQGTVETILVENATLVAAGQPLILIRKDIV